MHKHNRTFETARKMPTKEDRSSFTLDDILNSPKFVEQRVGNVTINAKQAMKAASPMNPIKNALKALKGAVNIFYDLTDNFDGDDSTSSARVPEVSIGRRLKGSPEDSTRSIKERVYGTVEAVETVAVGVSAVVQTIPVLAEEIIKLPDTLSSVKKETVGKMERTKESIDGDTIS
jgi:hypothetical protein